jgi:hypothetical protein
MRQPAIRRVRVGKEELLVTAADEPKLKKMLNFSRMKSMEVPPRLPFANHPISFRAR